MSYKAAIIGGGIISRNHLDAIRQLPEMTAVAVADPDLSKGTTLAQEYAITPYTDYREMVLVEKPDIVVIAVPHYLHREIAVWCCSKGCHLLLEKPMALNVKECDEILEAAESAGITLLVGHTQHYLPANIQAKKLIQRGELGELIAIQDTRHLHYYKDDRPDWFFEKAKSGGGIMMNLGAHSIDKIQFITGSRVARIRAALSYYGSKGDVEGSGMVFLQTTDGLSATIVQSGYEGVSVDTTDLIFTQGMARLISGKGLWISRNGQYEQSPLEVQEDPFVLQFRDLLEGINSGQEPESSGAYARTVIAAIEAIYASDAQGGEQFLETI
ncbi:Gfo/Idh/MocA family oxidoreductase [Paenibacillus zeisoli]|uniref:Gfo/Idh/MocA family oxidoreductase n=1 Tax=Paenibacillus zeisoli TaxID=2496267 RepID=A0A3S1B6P2_9BACL|nr:Gfo/Idh/MocA family oxidoreductase [Paenibacillus zeisoli]RUT29879.1 Gfo/Idh/MocA family oxidoreductase [Paenibacillus zeisoli]